jgi:hypothetical protein
MTRGRTEKAFHACGALGSYDTEVVSRMASALGERLSVAHRDRASMLILDRKPLAWSARSRAWAAVGGA